MRRGTFVVAASVMVAAAVAVRIHNALAFPSLHGYDGFGHFTYIWYMSKTWRVPLSTAGWSFFHPPLYYALMALLWDSLRGIDPLLRLSIGSLVMSLLSITHALVSYIIVKRYFPKQRLIHLLAPGMMLFLPVHIYSAPFIGNEGLAAVLCSVAILALLSALRRPSLTRSAMLGLWLGLAMLTKFTALAVVAGSFVTLALKGLRYWRTGTAMRHLAVVAGVMLTICGWYYARNIHLYGTPFKLSRSEFMVRHVENFQPRAARSLAEYVLFDPLIFRRPVWPRRFSISEDLEPGGAYRSVRESVWTGMYANTWFDGFGGWVVPPVTESEISRRSGQILMCLGLVPTLLVLLGLWTAAKKVWRAGWDDTLVALLVVFSAMIIVFIHGTRVVRIPAAVKATYLMPVTVAFSFWLALGLRALFERTPRLISFVTWECAFLALVSSVVFSYGLLFDPSAVGRTLPNAEASSSNLRGIIYYAAGDREKARHWFETAAEAGWHLGYENLAYLTLDAGRPLEALHLLRRAARLQPGQAFGRPADRARFNQITRAEYLNSMAVVYHELGWDGHAERAVRAALRLDAAMPEAHYNSGVLTLIEATSHSTSVPPAGKPLVERAKRQFSRAAALDPGFSQAVAMLGVAESLAGQGAEACATISRALSRHSAPPRKYPVETGTGVEHSASIGRRRLISKVPELLKPERQLKSCTAGNPQS